MGLDDGRKRWLIVKPHDDTNGKAILNTDNIVSVRGYADDPGIIYIDAINCDESMVADGNIDEIINYLRNGGIL